MNDRISFTQSSRLKFDSIRGKWVILSPESVFIPDETAVEILKLIDGNRTINEISLILNGLYQSEIEIIEYDVIELIESLKLQGVLK